MTTKTAFVRNGEGLYQTKGQVTPEEIIKTATEILFDQVSGRDAVNNPNDLPTSATKHYTQLRNHADHKSPQYPSWSDPEQPLQPH
jgi:hypothetical protein